jgi:hypothetical protein
VPVVHVQEGATQEQVEESVRKLARKAGWSRPPIGPSPACSLICGAREEGFRVVDVWEGGGRCIRCPADADLRGDRSQGGPGLRNAHATSLPEPLPAQVTPDVAPRDRRQLSCQTSRRRADRRDLNVRPPGYGPDRRAWVRAYATSIKPATTPVQQASPRDTCDAQVQRCSTKTLLTQDSARSSMDRAAV